MRCNDIECIFRQRRSTGVGHNRHVGCELLEYLLTGELQEFDHRRMAGSTELLCSDLQRQNDSGTTFVLNGGLRIPGKREVRVPILATRKDGRQFAIALSGPLIVGHPVDLGVAEAMKQGLGVPFVIVNELLVRGNLPAASREVQSRTCS
jgi:hypothetical protein